MYFHFFFLVRKGHFTLIKKKKKKKIGCHLAKLTSRFTLYLSQSASAVVQSLAVDNGSFSQCISKFIPPRVLLRWGSLSDAQVFLCEIDVVNVSNIAASTTSNRCFFLSEFGPLHYGIWRFTIRPRLFLDILQDYEFTMFPMNFDS